MSKTITIPDLGMDPVEVIVGGKKYEYKVGSTVTVPDEVADVLDHADDCYLAPAKEADSRTASISDVKTATAGFVTAEQVESLIAAALAEAQAEEAPVVIDLSGDDSPATYDSESSSYIIDDAETSNTIYHAVIAGNPVWVTHVYNDVSETDLVTAFYVDDSGADDVFCAVFGPDDGLLKLEDYEDESESEGDIAPIPIRPGTSVTVVLPSQS